MELPEWLEVFWQLIIIGSITNNNTNPHDG